MSDPMYDVAMAATDLKLGMPNEFERFVDAVKKLDERCRANLYAAGPDGIFCAQGAASLVHDLRTKLETCLQIRSQGEPKRK